MADGPDDSVEVVPYSDAWPGQFEQERLALEEALGEVASSVEHIGSTAVPGLSSKPTIDLLVVVDLLQGFLEHPDDRMRYVTEKAAWVDHRLAALRERRSE